MEVAYAYDNEGRTTSMTYPTTYTLNTYNNPIRELGVAGAKGTEAFSMRVQSPPLRPQRSNKPDQVCFQHDKCVCPLIEMKCSYRNGPLIEMFC
jgi:hypothetical protein